MKILFVNPHYPADPSTFLLHPPLGYAYLATHLTRAGHEVHHTDLPLIGNQPSDVLPALETLAPDIVAVTSVAQSYAQALEIAATVKAARPVCQVVFGGPHVSFVAQECLRRHSWVDFVLKFDSEESFVDLCAALGTANPQNRLLRVPGLAFRTSDGDVSETPTAPPVKDLDVLGHPDRSIFDMGRYLRNDYETVVMASRGCPSRCAFCSTSIAGRTYRWNTPGHVVREIEEVLDLGFQSIFFGDDTFAGNSRRLAGICDEIILRSIQVSWTCNIRAQDAHPRLLEKMRDAGAYRVFVGFESIQTETLKLVHKGSLPEQMIRKARLIQDAGLELHSSFIIGAPGDTHESLRETLDYIRALNPTIATFNTMEPRPGTDLYARPERYGIEIPDPYWYETTDWMRGPVCSTRSLSGPEIKEWVDRCYAAFCSPDFLTGATTEVRR